MQPQDRGNSQTQCCLPDSNYTKFLMGENGTFYTMTEKKNNKAPLSLFKHLDNHGNKIFQG